ncbi:trypsin-2-like [Maniola hyperantus]|uniref:trypsin-2-like n=1 Tax=Aphantopus hyperantus TaxID=2795564 RepID=UPI001569FF3A|nr:CLIP domain-containing serine protease 14D-like [Maniola hyperantus]
MAFKLLLLVFFVAYAEGQTDEGDKCTDRSTGMQGVCLNIRRCQTAIDAIRNKQGTPQLCSFASSDPVVCCMDRAPPTTARIPVATTSTQRPSDTTEYVPPVYDYVLNTGGQKVTDECEPLLANQTVPKTGSKAFDKCIEYQEKYVYPCLKSVALTGKKARTNRCKHNAKDLIVGGVAASEDEFPHMALIGYGGDINSVQWLCGGSLLSERFVLTAGHCTFTRNLGEITYVRIGMLKRTDPLDISRVYRVKRIVKHPGYNSPHRYNDIALVETELEMTLGQFAVPACLDTDAPNNYQQALATGWGATQNRGATADQLQKVILQKFTTAECTSMFPPHRLMMEGFDANTQICYGDKNAQKDTCQGDSGGPLQLKHKQIDCMYTVVGLTSFGRACGVKGEPGIYTRVIHYVPWIESVVWP